MDHAIQGASPVIEAGEAGLQLGQSARHAERSLNTLEVPGKEGAGEVGLGKRSHERRFWNIAAGMQNKIK